MDLADYNPDSVLGFIWGYSYNEIIDFYRRKELKYAERRKIDFEFLIGLATAALGGKKNEDEVALDTGEGLDEMTPEQEAALRAALGDDFDKVVGNN